VRIHYEDRTRQTVVVHAGHSIFNRNSRVNLGLMLTEFGGGGHRGAASSRFPSPKADQYIAKMIDTLVKNENNENPV
jgi:nanoRNase/pAp phosphatase (c-di-AMP/oligoRNAs hydrolase)